jgi:signal transduction histidine kinase
LSISVSAQDNDAVVAISDQGGGIPADIREKIFNLYFTTKSGGSGIGLPMTYRVVQLHNGSMDFDSVEGQGTTFRLRFPLSEQPVAPGIGTLASTEAVSPMQVARNRSESL